MNSAANSKANGMLKNVGNAVTGALNAINPFASKNNAKKNNTVLITNSGANTTVVATNAAPATTTLTGGAKNRKTKGRKHRKASKKSRKASKKSRKSRKGSRKH